MSKGVSERGLGRTCYIQDGWRTFAALDLGTNNCRLLVARPAGDGFRVIDSFSRIVRLGEGLQASGALGDAAMNRAMQALQACRARLQRRPRCVVRAVATEACRQATNGPAFLKRVLAETGIRFDIIAPREEAELALESCGPLLDRDSRRVLLFDIGGGSTELAWVRLAASSGPELIGYVSLPLGVVTLAERHGPAVFTTAGYAAMVAEAHQHLEAFEQVHRIAHEIRLGGVQGLGTSGTVTTLAGVAMKLARYRRPLVDGTTLSAAAADDALRQLRGMGIPGLHAHPCVGADRADFVLPGCAIFDAIRSMWPIEQFTVADRGLREGILQRLMRQDHGRQPARKAAASQHETALSP